MLLAKLQPLIVHLPCQIARFEVSWFHVIGEAAAKHQEPSVPDRWWFSCKVVVLGRIPTAVGSGPVPSLANAFDLTRQSQILNRESKIGKGVPKLHLM